MKVLLVTFSDNADHQDITFGMFESLYKAKPPKCDIWVMGINNPKVDIINTSHTHLVDCPNRPGIGIKTFALHELYSIIRWIKKSKFDVIFFETLHVWNLPIMLCCKNIRIYQMIHDVIPHTGDRQSKSVHLMNKVVCKLADFIVLANQKYIKTIIDTYDIDISRVKSVDMWRRFPDYTTPKHTGRLLFFGRMNPYKGVDNLLEIVKACPDISFDVVGRVDPQVQSITEELRKQNNVSLKDGYVTDSEMINAFCNADWILLPYNSATQSGVVIDGYRFGKPSIAYNVGAISEQIIDGKSGFLIEPGDNKAFASKLKELIGLEKEKYDTISVFAYRYGVQKYSAEGATDRFIDLIS